MAIGKHQHQIFNDAHTIIYTEKLMRLILQILTLAAFTTTLTACDGPFIFMAGGELSGPVQNPPATWQFEADSGVAQLETRPEEPYSINFSYLQMDGHLYLYAGDTRTNWVQNIEQNANARIRIDGTIYPVRAVRVNDRDELTRFAQEWKNMSVFQRDPMQFEEVWLYRLVPQE